MISFCPSRISTDVWFLDDAPLTSDVGEVLSADEIGSILNDQEISEGKNKMSECRANRGHDFSYFPSDHVLSCIPNYIVCEGSVS